MAVPEEKRIMPAKRAHRQRKLSVNQFAGLAVAPDCLDWAGFAGELFSTFPPDAALRAASTSGLPVFVVSGVTPAPVCRDISPHGVVLDRSIGEHIVRGQVRSRTHCPVVLMFPLGKSGEFALLCVEFDCRATRAPRPRRRGRWRSRR
jgi:hypothetical protein